MKKLIVLILFFCVSVIGFMVKLPVLFREHDKELHLLFYFGAAIFLSVLFARNNYFYHFLVLWTLSCFGVLIECSQEVSNLFVTKRIHGNFDIEDVVFNTMGLFIAFIVWTGYYLMKVLFNEIKKCL